MSSVTPPSLPPAPPETPSRRKPGGHPVLTSVAIAAVVLSSFVFLSLRSKTLKALNDLCPTWTTDSGTPGDWAFLVPSVAVVAATVAVGGLLAAVSAMKWKRGALAASLAALVAAPLLFVCAVLSLHMAFFARIGEAVAAHSEPATPAPATNAPPAFRATILGDRPAGPYLVSNRVARLRDTFGLPSPSGLRSAFDARSAPEGAVAERSFREEAGGTVSIRRERFLVPLSELPAERAFSDGFRVRLEPADGHAAPPPAEEDVSVFEEWHAALTGPAEPPPESVSPAVFLARRQMDPFGPPDEFEFSFGYRNHPALPEGTNVAWAGWLRSEQGAGFIEQSWPVRMNGQRLEIGHSVFRDGYRGGDLFLFEIRSLPLGRLPEEVPMTGCLLAISTDGSLPAVLYSDFPEEFRKTTAVANDPAVVRELLKDIEDIQRSGSDETHAESESKEEGTP